MGEEQKWPETLLIVRHGESAGNVARTAAERAGSRRIDLPTRDMDIPLSPLGERQARALGEWLKNIPPDNRPSVLLTSPYVRARRTAEIVNEIAGFALVPVFDERLREREFGILDGLTRRGIVETMPSEAERMTSLGKFYHRPPGGESWCDVFLRLRSAVHSLSQDYKNERVMIVAHQVSVLGFRYLLERLSEADILDIDHQGDIANCSVTSYDLSSATPNLKLFNFVSPVAQAGAAITSKNDVPLDKA